MDFNPLGNFNPSAPLDRAVVAKGKAFLGMLPDVPAGLLTRLYGHWTVAGPAACFADYNAEARLVNGEHVLTITHDPRDNAPGLNNNPVASHTWQRNTGGLGIAITGMDGATEQDFGPDPVTVAGLETLSVGAAALALKYDIDVSGTVRTPGSNHTDNDGGNVNTTGEHNFLTHGECAVIDLYPTERWDLGSFRPLPDGVELTPAMRTQCGDALRARIHAYKLALA